MKWLILAAALLTAVPAAAMEQFNCKVHGSGTIPVHLSTCVEPLTEPADCLHQAIFAAGESAYVTFASAERGFFPLWAPSPGWFHAPQVPYRMPGLDRVVFISATPQSMRVVGIALRSGEMGCP